MNTPATGSGGGDSARVLSVNVGLPRTIEWLGKTATTAIWKEPVAGRVPVRGVNVAGDDQADRTVHGGPTKAVYVYAREDAAWWEAQLGRPLPPGSFGENFTLAGVPVTEAQIGERWAIGTALFEVAQPRVPCWKLGARMNDPRFPVRFGAAGRPGAYLRILEEGEVGAGDGVTIVHRPAHGLTVGAVAALYHSRKGRLEDLLAVPELAPEWREWARYQLAHGRASR